MARSFPLLLLCLLLTPAVSAGQGLPAYRPMNPLLSGRTALGFIPLNSARAGWSGDLAVDYASVVESSQRSPASVLLDAEIFRTTLRLNHSLGSRGFLQLAGAVSSSQAGFLDGPVNWYHGLVGFNEATRRERPRNTFAYQLTLPDGSTVERESSGLRVTELSVAGGLRHSAHWQTVARVFVPTSGGSAGYGNPSVATGLVTTVRSRALGDRLTFEGSLGLGYSAPSGELAEWQRRWLASASGGARLRFWGQQAIYANLFLHSSAYQGTSVPALDREEASLDFGFLFRPGRGPEIVAGLVEDLYAFGPAVDLVIRLGARW